MSRQNSNANGRMSWLTNLVPQRWKRIQAPNSTYAGPASFFAEAQVAARLADPDWANEVRPARTDDTNTTSRQLGNRSPLPLEGHGITAANRDPHPA